MTTETGLTKETAVADQTPISDDERERVRRFLDEHERPTPFAPQGFLPVDHIATITRSGDSLLVSDLRALLAENDALRARLAAAEQAATLTDDERERLATWLRHRGVYSFGLLCDIADCVGVILAARLAAMPEATETVADRDGEGDVKFRVKLIESDSWSGPSSWTEDFDTYDEAEQRLTSVNAANISPVAPSYYVKAKKEIEAVRVSISGPGGGRGE